MKMIGKKRYEVCGGCGEIVCLDKWLFGSLHTCAPEEIRYNPLYIKENYIQNYEALYERPYIEPLRKKVEYKPFFPSIPYQSQPQMPVKMTPEQMAHMQKAQREFSLPKAGLVQ